MKKSADEKKHAKFPSTLRKLSYIQIQVGLDPTKPVFGVSDKTRLKLVSSATETS